MAKYIGYISLNYWTQFLQLFFHEINLLYIVTCIVSMSNTGKQQFFANQLSDKDRSVPNEIDLDRPIYIVKNNNIFEIRGYVWCVQYRIQIHLRTKKGSGGVGFLIKQSFYEEYDLSIIDSETEGILWLKF